MEPAQVVRDEHPSWIVIGTLSGDELVLRTPHLQGDTLVVGSLVESIGDYPDPPDLVGIPLTEVAWVGTGKPDRIARAKVLANTVAFPVVLHFPRILSDSLVGSTTTPSGRRVLEERVAYALEEIEGIEVEEFETERTTLVIGSLLGAWFLLLLLVQGAES